MRLAIDWDVCIGAGRCIAQSPDAFELVETEIGPRAVLRAPADSADLLRAASDCPTLAIRLWDGEGRPIYPPA